MRTNQILKNSQEDFCYRKLINKPILPKGKRDSNIFNSLENSISFVKGSTQAFHALVKNKFSRTKAVILAQINFSLNPKSRIKKVLVRGKNYIHANQDDFCFFYLSGLIQKRSLRNYTKELEQEGLIHTTDKLNTRRVKGNLPHRRKWYSLGKPLILDGIVINIQDLLAYARTKPAIGKKFTMTAACKLYQRRLRKIKRIEIKKYRDHFNKRYGVPHQLKENVDKTVDNSSTNQNCRTNKLYNINNINIYKQGIEDFKTEVKGLVKSIVKPLWNLVNAGSIHEKPSEKGHSLRAAIDGNKEPTNINSLWSKVDKKADSQCKSNIHPPDKQYSLQDMQDMDWAAIFNIDSC